MTAGDFLKTKNVYYSGIAGLISGAMGGQLPYTAVISSAIAIIDTACFPEERPAHISGGKWFLGNLLSSTASGIIAWAIGHSASNAIAGKDNPHSFVKSEDERRSKPCGACEKTR
jgi:hypothetical protein